MRLLDKERKKKKEKKMDIDDNDQIAKSNSQKSKEIVTDDLVVGTVFHLFDGRSFNFYSKSKFL